MGFSLGEILLIVVVGIIVVGPKRLPGLMRTAGQWVARLRRMSSDLRSQSGIDDILRHEGLDEHINQIRSLSRMNVVESLMAPPLTSSASASGPRPTITASANSVASPMIGVGVKAPEPSRGREHPLVGCDNYGALPDDAPVEATVS